MLCEQTIEVDEDHVIRAVLERVPIRNDPVSQPEIRIGLTLDQAATLAADADIDTLALDDVLSRLAEMDERKARVAEMRFFGGMSIEHVAEAIGIARSTVAEDWRMARAWLAKELLDAEGAT